MKKKLKKKGKEKKINQAWNLAVYDARLRKHTKICECASRKKTLP